MKDAVTTRWHTRSSSFILICTALIFVDSPLLSYSQCSTAPVAAATCSGGNGAATSGVNINSGNTYWFSGGPSTFSGINLNSGGTLRVCGSLTLSGINYNGGTLIIESGGSLTINASISASGVTIINRGTLTINGSLTLQGSNNYLYNDLTTSVLNISGTLTLNGSTSYVINRGVMTANTLTIQGATGEVCLQDNAILNLANLNNNAVNSFTYSGSGSPACLNVSNSASLNNDVASSSLIHVCTSSSVSGGASSDANHGWGSATVYNGCTSCTTVLSLNISSFTAVPQTDGILLQWTTHDEPSGNEFFYVEKSVDDSTYFTLTSIEAMTGQYLYSASDAEMTAPKQYYRIRAVSASGATFYSPIVLVETSIAQILRVYPNPVGPDRVITLVLPSSSAGTAQLSLANTAGQTIRRRSAALVTGSNQLSWNLGGIAEGIYIIKISFPAGGGSLYSRIAVTKPY